MRAAVQRAIQSDVTLHTGAPEAELVDPALDRRGIINAASAHQLAAASSVQGAVAARITPDSVVTVHQKLLRSVSLPLAAQPAVGLSACG